MFYLLLLITFIIALACCFIVVKIFNSPISKILKRIINEEISEIWVKYIKFALYVVGISGGVRIWNLEKYITATRKEDLPIALNLERWTLEIYRTLIGSLQSIAWMLLVFFVFTLIAFVIVKTFENRKKTSS